MKRLKPPLFCSELPRIKRFLYEEYIKKLTCDGCGKRCPLSSPQCGIGASQLEKAKIEYEKRRSTSLETPLVQEKEARPIGVIEEILPLGGILVAGMFVVKQD